MIRTALYIAAAAFALRLVAAGIDTARPVFPAHYYNDARSYDADAKRLLASWRAGQNSQAISPGRELYTVWSAALYALFGERPFVVRAANALMAALAIMLWYLLVARAISPAAALLNAILLSVWPTHVFYTSQHLKESMFLLFQAAALTPLVWLWTQQHTPPPRKAALLAAMSSGAVILMGFVRAPVVWVFIAALSAASCWDLWKHRRSPRLRASALVPAALILGGLLYKPVAAACIRLLQQPAPADSPALLQAIHDLESPGQEKVSPYSPKGIARYRINRQIRSQIWSRDVTRRKINTQIFPNQQLETWGDLALFLPKVIFYALFMPLPGLYPIAGNIGRLFNAMENVVLLALAVLALPGIGRTRWSSPLLALALYFSIIVPPSALLEYDLGSAARHRLQHFPFLFPFACAWILTILPARPRRAIERLSLL